MLKVFIVGFVSLLSASCQIIESNQPIPHNFVIPTLPDSFYLKGSMYEAKIDQSNKIEVKPDESTL